MPTDNPQFDPEIEASIIALTRATISSHLETSSLPTNFEGLPKSDSNFGVFVTLRTAEKELRGCIGRIGMSNQSLWLDLQDAACDAATRDPRFAPLQAIEFSTINVEVSILTEPEPVEEMTALDPKRYGIVIQSGPRRGVLLPGIEGVDTIEEQLAITRKKARIFPNEDIVIQRFEVTKIRER